MHDSEIPVQRHLILVVDDDAWTLRATERLLTATGFACLSAGGGIEAIEILTERYLEIDLVLSDLQMPGLDGLALLRRLRQSEFRTPFVLHSGTEPQEDWKEADAIILKPAQLSSLAKTFASLIGSFSADVEGQPGTRICPACCQRRRSLGMPDSFRVGTLGAGHCDTCEFKLP